MRNSGERARARGEPWTDAEINVLDGLLQLGATPSEISDSLKNRSEVAIKHAISRIIFQQLLVHTPEEIADRYKRDVSWVEEGIVHKKYYIDFESEDTDDEVENENDILGDDINKQNIIWLSGGEEVSGTDILIVSVFSMFACLVVSGMGYYGCALYEHGFGIINN